MKQKVKSQRPLFRRGLVGATACVMLLGTVSYAHAASSEWVETEGGRIRLTTLAPNDEGVIRGILDIDLSPGWKTYWRDPGDAGVPPSIGIDASVNVKDLQLDFPPPERIDDGYSIWAGYSYPVALPITLTQDRPGDASRLEADVFLGLCETICIPFKTRLSVEIDPDETPNSFEMRLVEDAHASLPQGPETDFDVIDTVLSDTGDSLTLWVTHPESSSDAELFITGPMGWYFDIPKRTDSADDRSAFTIDIVDRPEGGHLSGHSLRLLVTTSDRSMETEVMVP